MPRPLCCLRDGEQVRLPRAAKTSTAWHGFNNGGTIMGNWLRSRAAARIITVIIILVANPLLRLGIDWRNQRAWQAAKPRLAQDLRTLDPVLHALEQYHLDHPMPPISVALPTATYPASLQELVPRYLKALPPLPPALSDFEYQQTHTLWGLPAGHRTDTSGSCELRIRFHPRTKWFGLVAVGPAGSLVYRGLGWTMNPDALSFHYLANRTAQDRLAGWEYYAPSRPLPPRDPSQPDPRQAVLKSFREARLKALEPYVLALDRYTEDHQTPPKPPGRLQDLVPRYLPSLPKLPPVFGPLRYEPQPYAFRLWVPLNEQVTDAAGKPLDLSGTFMYVGTGAAPELLLDQQKLNSRPLRQTGVVGQWILYD